MTENILNDYVRRARLANKIIAGGAFDSKYEAELASNEVYTMPTLLLEVIAAYRALSKERGLLT